MKKLDGKFHGIIVKNKDQSIVPQDQWIVFLAKDNAVPEMLEYYRKLLVDMNAKQEQIQAVDQLMQRVFEWRHFNAALCKVSDVEPGEIIT